MIRRKNNQVQSPIVRLWNQNLDKEVILIGTCHVGNPVYYETINEVIDILEENNYTILYEGIKGEVESSVENSIENNAKEQLNDLNSIINELCELMNLQFQVEGLRIRDKWINTDLSASELDKLLRDNGISILSSTKDFSKYDKKSLKWLFSKGLGAMAFIEKFDWIRNIFSKKHNLIVNYRNVVAVNGIKNHIENNVVSIWGAGHLDGMVKLLEKEGFTVQDRVWLTFYNVKSGENK